MYPYPHFLEIDVKIILCDRYDSRVKAMEVDEKPTETYGDIGGLDKQIEEVWGLCYVC